MASNLFIALGVSLLLLRHRGR